MTDAGITPPFAKEDLDNIGSPDDYLTTVRDVSAYVDIKKESLSCHRTQLDPNGPFGAMAPDTLTAWMSTEYFYLVQPTNGEAQEDILAKLA
jgi:LmbE family N-acetylglucosaminyl deacetylase